MTADHPTRSYTARMRLILEEVALERQMLQERMAASRKTTASITKVLPPPLARVHMRKLVYTGVATYLVFVAVLVKLFNPSLIWMSIAAVFFTPVGVGLSWVWFRNGVIKTETKEQVLPFPVPFVLPALSPHCLCPSRLPGQP